MAVIERNDFGAVAVNNKVLYKLIAGQILSMQDYVFPCNKKGKIIKNKPTPFIDPDLYDAIELKENRGNFIVNVYIVLRFGISISDTCKDLFDKIEDVFLLLKLPKPKELTISVKGLMTNQLVSRDIRFNRINSGND